jgi:hypothetical protein
MLLPFKDGQWFNLKQHLDFLAHGHNQLQKDDYHLHYLNRETLKHWYIKTLIFNNMVWIDISSMQLNVSSFEIFM